MLKLLNIELLNFFSLSQSSMKRNSVRDTKVVTFMIKTLKKIVCYSNGPKLSVSQI